MAVRGARAGPRGLTCPVCPQGPEAAAAPRAATTCSGVSRRSREPSTRTWRKVRPRPPRVPSPFAALGTRCRGRPGSVRAEGRSADRGLPREPCEEPKVTAPARRSGLWRRFRALPSAGGCRLHLGTGSHRRNGGLRKRDWGDFGGAGVGAGRAGPVGTGSRHLWVPGLRVGVSRPPPPGDAWRISRAESAGPEGARAPRLRAACQRLGSLITAT